MLPLTFQMELCMGRYDLGRGASGTYLYITVLFLYVARGPIGLLRIKLSYLIRFLVSLHVLYFS